MSAFLSPAYGTSRYALAKGQIAINGNWVSSPYRLEIGGTTYMPMWYVTKALEQLGVRNSWNGRQLELWTPPGFSTRRTDISPGSGNMSICIDGTLVQNVSGISYLDPASQQPTTYMPIWYVIQALNRMGMRSNWDGTIWDLWNTPVFGAAFQNYLKSRSSNVSVAVYDESNGQTYLYHPNLRFDTASIVKAIIMADLLHQSTVTSRPLTPYEQDLMTPMIEYSNNNDASQLWDLAGRFKGIQQFLTTAGMDQTTPGRYGYWGLTQTSAFDEVKLISDYAYPNRLIGNSQRAYGLNLMEHVVSWEHWGVSGGIPNGVTVALKNGWLPIGSRGWEINSIGYIDGQGRNYVVAVLTDNNGTEDYGITTIEGISRILWQEL